MLQYVCNIGNESKTIMARESSQTKACACHATHNQKLITQEQLQIIQSFLSIGNQNSSLQKFILERSGQGEWMLNQTLIFLGLVSFQPQNSTIMPPLRIAAVWSTLVLCTREYVELCEKSAGRYIHHVPNALSAQTKRRNWFKNWKRLTHFLNNQIPEYDESWWHPIPDYEVITSYNFYYYKQRQAMLPHTYQGHRPPETKYAYSGQ